MGYRGCLLSLGEGIQASIRILANAHLRCLVGGGGGGTLK